jgi:CMP-2-keto-3-deoxyoctulosonic acid synthetase
MNDYLKEAKRVVEGVFQIFGYLNKFDEIFVECLKEEIEQSVSLKEPKAVFTVNELGDVSYEGIFEATNIVDPTKLVISLNLSRDLDLLEDKDISSLIEELKEKYNKEKTQLLENLDQITADFDKQIVEVVSSKIKEKKEEVTLRVAKEYLDLDIATKKQKLLDKLLGNKNENISK